MMIPRFSSGANTADLAPMTTLAPPRRMRRHSSKRSPSDSLECKTAASPPKRARNQFTICGVSEISGTSTMAVRPDWSVSRIARMYTSVLPLPVTPCSRNLPPPPRSASVS